MTTSQQTSTPTVDEHRPELALLLACARTRLDDAARRARDGAIAAGIDWEHLLAMAEEHRLTALLATHLAGAPIPPEITQRLGTAAKSSLVHAMQLTGQLVQIIESLRAQGIRAIPFKGPMLAQCVYGNLAARPFDDIDILAAPAQAPAAARALVKMGFESWDFSPAEEAALLQSECAHTFFSADGQSIVDLHWLLNRRYLAGGQEFDPLWSRATPVTIAGCDVPTLAVADLLPLLCVHGAKHNWERLIWVCDIAELLRRIDRDPSAWGPIDWDALLSNRDGSARAILLGASLAQSLLDAPLPAAINHALQADKGAAALAALVRRRLLEGHLKHGIARRVRESLFHLRVMRRWSDRLRYVLLAAEPNVRDRRFVHLPRPLHPLYYLVRPLRLLMRG